jgi:hypothetical protein
MFIADLLTAFILTIIIMLPFYFLGRVGPWEGWIWFALLLFLFTWAGGAWVRPYGPVSQGYAWLPFLFFGLFFAFLIAAAVPPRPPRNRREAIRQARAENEAVEATSMALGIFFWILLVGLILALILRYTM